MSNWRNESEGEAIVTETIVPPQRGRVRFRGTCWPARCDRQVALSEGTFVRVVDRQGIVLVVRPEDFAIDTRRF